MIILGRGQLFTQEITIPLPISEQKEHDEMGYRIRGGMAESFSYKVSSSRRTAQYWLP